MQKVFKDRKQRRSFGLPIVLCLANDGMKLPARLNNISEGGINFKSNVLFPEGEMLDVEIPYPQQAIMSGNKQPITLKVKVVWSENHRDEKDPLVRFIHGCEFVSDQDNQNAEGIKELIKLSEKLGEKPLGF